MVWNKSLVVVCGILASLSYGGEAFAKKTSFKKNDLKKVKCSFSGEIKKTELRLPIDLQFPINPDEVVCDPLAGQGVSRPEQGLFGKLILKSESMPARVTSVLDYYRQGNKLSADLFFKDINVPTRKFDQGFVNLSGQSLVDANGQKLIENFAIEYSTLLKLAPGQEPGHYELALLSDDGALLFAYLNGKWENIVNNDGLHPTRMGCAFKTLYLDANTEIPVKVLYYQGPRYHISNVLIWKRHSAEKNFAGKKDQRRELCGVQGNHVFFNVNQPERKTGAMKTLEKRGWQVVRGESFKMPPQKENPCVNEELAISDFVMVEIGADYAILEWKTNLPATSQIRLKSLYTGKVILSQVDTVLKTQHRVRIDNLETGGLYEVQAISVGADGKEIVSPPPPVIVSP